MKKVLTNIKQGWLTFAHRFGRAQTALIMTLFYFLILSPVGLILRLFGWDPLETGRFGSRRSSGSNWKPIKPPKDEIGSLRRMS